MLSVTNNSIIIINKILSANNCMQMHVIKNTICK